ncbi:MAG: general secretion pathway protein GspK [Deltaproteobacteria bacterium]|nr:general secretion pathway protein GspK [Deltaproteobacteria bacterium]
MVLGITMVLATLATDFALSSQLQLRLAATARDRLQAEYLAHSAVNFMRLELKIERSAKELFAKLPAGTKGVGAGPLCKQFPLSTELLRAVFIPDSAAAASAEGEAAQARGRMTTVFDAEVAESFLDFGSRGDFRGECVDEGGKFNLNVFHNLDPLQPMLAGAGPNLYDRYKELLTALLAQERYATLFGEGATERIREIARNIADWVDKNEQVNERGGAQGGSESAPYAGGEAEYKVKNGKMLTLDEAYQIAGVSDEWFTPMQDLFTVYGEAKINICSAPPEIVEAVVTGYTLGNPKFPAFTPANREVMAKVLSTVESVCGETQPQPGKVAQEIDTLLTGLAPAAALPPTPPGGSAATGTTLASFIATESRVYRLMGIGEVRAVRGEDEVTTAQVRITTVVDVKESDPKKWKMLYWRSE